jgi:hypothetical protein
VINAAASGPDPVRLVLAYLENDDDDDDDQHHYRLFSLMDVELHCIIRRRSSPIV